MVKDNSIGSLLLDGVLVLILCSLALLCILPLWYTLCLSLSEKSYVAAGMVRLWPVGFNFNSYVQIMSDFKFFNSFWISIQRVVLGTICELTVTILMAYPLSRNVKQFRGRNIITWFLVFSMLFYGGLVPWYQTMKSLGMINSIWGLVLGGSVPIFNVILVMNYFRNLPKEIEEAALMDGAGPWNMLFNIFIPLSLPVIATVTLFSVVYHWNEFFSGLILMTRQANYPLQTYIQQVVVVINTSAMTPDELKRLSELSNQTLNAAKIFISMIPILLIYPLLQKYFITGITLGSVKE
jgi:putative aldouronate transport system permease protein